MKELSLLGEGEASDESRDALVSITRGNVTIPDRRGNPAVFVNHEMNTKTPVCLRKREVADVGD